MGLSDTVEQALGSRRSDAAPPPVNPRAILASELENERRLLSTAAPESRPLHEGNIQAIQRELSGQSGGVGGQSGDGVASKPLMSGERATAFTPQKGGLADIVESAMSGDSSPANVSTGKVPPKLSDSPRSILDRIPTTTPEAFSKKQVQPSDLGDAAIRGVRGVGASILGGYEGLRVLANGRGSEAAADATRATIERGTGRPDTAGGILLQDIMHSPFNPLTWPARVGQAVGDATLRATGKPGAATAVDTAINALPALLMRGQGSSTASVPRLAANETVRESVSRPQTASVPISQIGNPIDITAQNPVGFRAAQQQAVTTQPLAAVRPPLQLVPQEPVSPKAATAWDQQKPEGGVTVRGNATAVANPVEAAAAAKGITWEQQAALETIKRFAKDPEAILRSENKQLVPGSKPTLAEVTKDPGLAQLQRSQQSKSTELANDIADNRIGRQSARTSLMEQFAGSPEEMAYFTDARRQITRPLYEAAQNKVIDFTKQPLEIKREMGDLLKKPAIQDAIRNADALAKNEGIAIKSDQPIQHMHYMKMALDSEISKAVKAGDNTAVRVLHGVQDQLVGLMQKLSPEYAKAMSEFEAASRPINRLEVGQYLKEKLLPAVNGYGGDRTTIGQFVKALEHPDQTAKLATKFSGAKMSNILSKDEISTLKSLAEDVVRQQNVESAARITGSQTAQLQAAQSKLSSRIEWLVNKLKYSGVPVVSHGAAGIEVTQQFINKGRAVKYEGELNRMLMDPDYAKSVYAKSQGVKP